MNKTSILYRALSRLNRNVFRNTINRIALKNENFTIISNTCVGSLICHDLNQKFLTPTVNLYMYTEDFTKFILNLDRYKKEEIIEIKKPGITYPIGKLGDIVIYFMHYKCFKEAKDKWYERIKRIDHNNLFIMMVDNDACSETIVKQFETIPYRNKILFSNNKKYINYSSVFYISGFEKNEYIGDMTLYRNLFGKKVYDEFNYVKWLNNGLKL